MTLLRLIVNYRHVFRDRRTPKSVKWLLRLFFGYILTPFDLMPDCIPVLGCLDELVIVPGFLLAARRITTKEVLADCRKQVPTIRLKLLMNQG